MTRASETSVYDRMCWPDGELEQALASGAHRRELIAHFGARDYQVLRALARQALRRSRAARATRRELARRTGRAHGSRAGGNGRMTVYLVPGMMGSQLGWRRPGGEPPDLLWLDPADVAAGRLTALRWTGARTALRPLGAIPHTYLALRLRLAAAGLDVVTYDYDWRCDLSVLARALAARLAADPADKLVLLGHSMGGLLARAALAHSGAPDARVAQVIGLGAPHGGSIGAVQALRGTYPVILRLAALDPQHDAQALTAAVFGSFMSLYQMIPSATGALDLFDPSAWPAPPPPPAVSGQRFPAPPDPRLLARARRFQAQLAAVDARFTAIIGTGQRTVTGIAREHDQFRYQISAAGDGTVAASRAALAGARNYSLRCEHSELPRSARVAAAVIDLCLLGGTRRLREGIGASRGQCVDVTDTLLREAFAAKLDWERLSLAARRRYLNRLNAPPALYRSPREAEIATQLCNTSAPSG